MFENLPELPEKFCGRCQSWKPLSEFPPNRAKKDGLQNYCKPCYKSYLAGYYDKNKETFRIKRKEAYWKNPTGAKQAALDWYNENRDQAAATRRAWYDKNREHVKKRTKKNSAVAKETNPERWNNQKAEGAARRRARVKEVTAEAVSYEEVIQRDGYWCYLCSSRVVYPRDVHIDHVIPVVRGGTHTFDNLKVTHGLCNDSKGKQTPWEWWKRHNIEIPPGWETEVVA